MFKKFSRLGQAFMLPIAILPVAGLLLGLGAALSAFPFLGVSWLQTLFSIIYKFTPNFYYRCGSWTCR